MRRDSRRREDDPVVCISWQDAKAYADWLSRQTGEHYRLPTQQEWMHVAQAIVVATGCGGGNFSADSCDDGYANTAPVGRFPATRYGLYDVVGNVAVWTADCAEAVQGGACRAHVIRGLVVARRARPGAGVARNDERGRYRLLDGRRSVCCVRFPRIMRVSRSINTEDARRMRPLYIQRYLLDRSPDLHSDLADLGRLQVHLLAALAGESAVGRGGLLDVGRGVSGNDRSTQPGLARLAVRVRGDGRRALRRRLGGRATCSAGA